MRQGSAALKVMTPSNLSVSLIIRMNDFRFTKDCKYDSGKKNENACRVSSSELIFLIRGSILSGRNLVHIIEPEFIIQVSEDEATLVKSYLRKSTLDETKLELRVFRFGRLIDRHLYSRIH